MKRMPVVIDRPDCYSLFNGASTCRACPCRKSCRSVTTYFSKLVTIEDLLYQLQRKVIKPMTTAEAASFVVDEFSKIGGKLPYFAVRNGNKWKESLRRVIDTCNSVDIDARLYLKAQIRTIGKWTVRTHRRFYPNMLLGKNAQTRFEEWVSENKKNHGDAHFLESEYDESFFVEALFIEKYFESEDSASEVSSFIRKKYPWWSLSKGRENRLLRVKSLRDFLAGVNVTFPRRICVYSSDFKYGAVRRVFHKLIT